MTEPVTWGDLQKLAAEAGFTNPPVGDYLMEVTKSTYKQSSAGNNMITIVLKVVTGPHTGATQPHNLVASANTMGFFMRYARALGFDDAFFASYSAMQIAQVVQLLAPMLVGRRTLVTIAPDRNDAERLVVGAMKRPPVGFDAVTASPLAPVPPAAQAAAQSVPPPPPITHAQPAAVPVPAPAPAPTAGPQPLDYATAPEPPF